MVVYTCQKSFNFIIAFACYKQKCKLAPFNLAHPANVRFRLLEFLHKNYKFNLGSTNIYQVCSHLR